MWKCFLEYIKRSSWALLSVCAQSLPDGRERHPLLLMQCILNVNFCIEPISQVLSLSISLIYVCSLHIHRWLPGAVGSGPCLPFLPRSCSSCSLNASSTVFSPFLHTAESQELFFLMGTVFPQLIAGLASRPHSEICSSDVLSEFFSYRVVSCSPLQLSFPLLFYLPCSYLTDFTLVSWLTGCHLPTRL